MGIYQSIQLATHNNVMENLAQIYPFVSTQTIAAPWLRIHVGPESIRL